LFLICAALISYTSATDVGPCPKCKYLSGPDKIVLNPKKNVDELLNIKMVTFELPEWKLSEFIALLFEDKSI